VGLQRQGPVGESEGGATHPSSVHVRIRVDAIVPDPVVPLAEILRVVCQASSLKAARVSLPGAGEVQSCTGTTSGRGGMASASQHWSGLRQRGALNIWCFCDPFESLSLLETLRPDEALCRMYTGRGTLAWPGLGILQEVEVCLAKSLNRSSFASSRPSVAPSLGLKSPCPLSQLPKPPEAPRGEPWAPAQSPGALTVPPLGAGGEASREALALEHSSARVCQQPAAPRLRRQPS